MNKAMAVLVDARNPASPETVRAVQQLKKIGTPTIPKLLEAFGTARSPEILVTLLIPLVQNATVPLFSQALASSNARIVAGAVEVLRQGRTYNPHLLLEGCTDVRVSKTALRKILTHHQDALQPTALLRCLERADPEGRLLLLDLLDHMATANLVPALIHHTTSPDTTVRLRLARILARFSTEAVRDTLVRLLEDPEPPVRQAALTGLASLSVAYAAAPVCHCLGDADPTVRRQAVALLKQCHDPQLVPVLFDLLQDATPEVEQSVFEILDAVADTGTITAVLAARPDTPAVQATLLRLLAAPQTRVRLLALDGLMTLPLPDDIAPLCRLLWDPDQTMRHRAATFLAQLQDVPRLLPTLLKAVQDDSLEVRQAAVTLLNATGSPDAIKALLDAARVEEWWVTARLVDAVGTHGGPIVIRAILQLLMEADTDTRQSAIEILTRTQDPQVFEVLLEALDSPSLWQKTCAAEALVALGDKRAVPVLLRLVYSAETEAGLVALRTLATLGDPHVIPPLLDYVRNGIPVMQQAALRVVATLADAAHAEMVFQAVMQVRETADATVKALANETAAALLRKFGAHALGGSAQEATGASGLGAPALPHQMQAQNVLTTPAERPAHPVHMTPEASASKPIAAARMAPLRLEPGEVLGDRYRVIRRVGQGGFGTVFLVEDLEVSEQLILKFLHPQLASDERIRKRFIHELRYARRIAHENVIRLHDFLTLGSAVAISMEYFPGHDLAYELRDHTPLPLTRGLKIIWDVCRGMRAAHQVQIVHRDLKPANILVNDRAMVKIVDFGLAAAALTMDTRLTKTGSLLGTPMYMAPEQVQSRLIDARTDIYSLGIIMYEVFVGRPPYRDENPMAILFQHIEGKATPPRALNPDLPEELEAIILKAMAVKPEERFQTLEALSQSLAGCIRTIRALRPVA
jgi:serine/threonine-protein kinase